MRPSLVPIVALTLFAACGPEGLNQPQGLRPSSAANVTAATHDESDGGCGGAPEANDSSCPATWAGARALCSQGTICPALGSSCSYPNSGDGLPDGTWSTASLLCTDIHASALGLDAGIGVWTCAQ